MKLFMLRDAEPVRNSLYPPAGLKRKQKDIAMKATLQEVEELRMVTLKARKNMRRPWRLTVWPYGKARLIIILTSHKRNGQNL